MVFRRERFSGVHVFELRHRADVARAQLWDGNLLLSLQQLQLAHAFFVIFCRVPVRSVRFESAGEHAEQRYASGEWIGECFENECRWKCFGAPLERDFLPFRVAALDRLRFVGRRQQRRDGIENRMAADIVRCRIEHHRENLMMPDLAFETVDQLFLRQTALLEKALHQSVVAFRHFLNELLAPIVGVALHVRRNVRGVELARTVRCVFVGLHRNEINDPVEILLFADRKVDRHHVLAEFFLQRFERPRK